MKRYFLLILLLIPPLCVLSQVKKYGAGVGLGGIKLIGESVEHELGVNDGMNFIGFSFSYYRSSSRERTHFKTGLSFDIRQQPPQMENPSGSISSIRVPLGVEFWFGEETNLFFGFGTYFSQAVGSINYPAGDVVVNRGQLGIGINIGVAFKCAEKTQLCISYEQNTDFTPWFYTKGYSPGHAYYTENYFGIDRFVKVALVFGSKRGAAEAK